MNLAPYRKLIAAIVGAIGTAVSLSLVPDEVGDWLAVAVTFLTVAGVYAVPNAPLVARDAKGRFKGNGGQSLVTVLLVIALVLMILWFLGVNVQVD